jgi:hypothetical protein
MGFSGITCYKMKHYWGKREGRGGRREVVGDLQLNNVPAHKDLG